MANGITVRQAIDTELEGKNDANMTNADTIRCIRHLAVGIDSMGTHEKRLSGVERRVKLHTRIFIGVWSVTGGLIVAFFKKQFGL